MDSDLHQQQQQLMTSGLTRYRSAPSSYFSNLINTGVYGDEDIDPFFNPRVSSPETEQILSRFISAAGGDGDGDNSSSHQNLGQIGGKEQKFMDSVKQEHEVTFSSQQQQQVIYRSQAQSQQASRHNNPVVSSSSSSSAMDDPVIAMNPPTSLLRQSSSPAGFFAHLDDGYSVMRSMDNFGAGCGSVPDSLLSSAKRLKSQMVSSGLHSSSRPLSRIPENEGKAMGTSGAHNDGGFGDPHLNAGGYVASFHGGSWDEPAILTDGFLKELGESERNTFSTLNSSDNQNDEGRIHAPTTLTHHLSFPTSSAELSAMDKLLQFQDSVPLRSRAKRGCATHPRSIAERVRRTRISERMRKLQDLVPNMDKQTNTADMLDLAVDYIKELQKQVETLSDHRAKCTCPNKQEL